MKLTMTLKNLKLKASSPFTSPDSVEIRQALGQTAYFRVGFFLVHWVLALSTILSFSELFFPFSCFGAEIRLTSLLVSMSWD